MAVPSSPEQIPRRIVLALLLIQLLAWQDAPLSLLRHQGKPVSSVSSLPVRIAWLVGWLDRTSPDSPLFRVGDRVERAALLQGTKRAFLGSFSAQGLEPPEPERLQDYLRSVLENRVMQITLRNEAERRGLAVDERAVTRLSYDMFHEIKRSGSQPPPADELRERARETLLVEALLQAELAPTEPELQSFYEQPRARFVLPDAALLHEVLWPIAPWLSTPERAAADDEAAAQAHALAAELGPLTGAARLARLRAPAKGLETYRSSWVEPAQLPRELRDELQAAGADQIVGPLRSAYGHHIAWVERRGRDVTPSLGETRARVVDLWRGERREATKVRLANAYLGQRAAVLLLPDEGLL